MKLSKPLIITAALICGAAVFSWYSTVTGTATAPAGKTEHTSVLPRPVPTTLVSEASVQTVRMFPGTVQARANVDIAFSVEGVLKELNGLEGRVVKKGEVLARLDQRDFKNNRDAALAAYKKAAADFKRANALHKRNVISQAEYDAAKAASDVARAELNIREKALEDTVITSPFDGVIAKRYVENNEHVKKQAPILAIKDISEIEILIQIPENLMAQGSITRFKDINVTFDTNNDQWFSGEIKEYLVQSDPVTHTFEIAIRLETPDDLNILPGMTATVRVATDNTILKRSSDLKAVGLIPVESVFSSSDGKSYTWLIPDTPGNPKKVAVELGSIINNHIEVLSGLQPGNRIAVAGIHSLSEKMIVRPMKADGEGLDG